MCDRSSFSVLVFFFQCTETHLCNRKKNAHILFLDLLCIVLKIPKINTVVPAICCQVGNLQFVKSYNR